MKIKKATTQQLIKYFRKYPGRIKSGYIKNISKQGRKEWKKS